MAEQEAEKQKGKLFNVTRPMVPAKQVWKPKQIKDATTSTSIAAAPMTPKEEDAAPITSSPSPIASSSLGQISDSVDTLEEDDDMLDYEPTPDHEGMYINMVY